METMVTFLVGFSAGAAVSVFVLLLSERYNKLQRQMSESLQKNLDEAIKKIMAVDYEKLAAIDAHASATAEEAWLQIQRQDDQYFTPELSDHDVFDLADYRLRTQTGEQADA